MSERVTSTAQREWLQAKEWKLVDDSTGGEVWNHSDFPYYVVINSYGKIDIGDERVDRVLLGEFLAIVNEGE